jgi:catechol 2,3-dioxygenase-like lactoylglutathione lyase family enzyme
MEEGPPAQEEAARDTAGGGQGGEAQVVGAGDKRARILGIDHVNVTTPEELESDVVEWYAGVVGLERIDKPPGARSGGLWFKAGDQELHVSIDPHNPPKTAHFGIVVDDFEEIVSRLRAEGCHIEQAAAIPGRRRCYTRDPAGNRIEIVSFDAPIEHPERVETSEDPGAGRRGAVG